MRITVSGLPGSGTTSLARTIASRKNFQIISAGEVFRRMASEKSMDLAEFGKLAREDPSFDRLIDERQRDIALANDDIVVEGRLSGWFVEDADLKIWLCASLECRVERILERDLVANSRTAFDLTREREECEAQRYLTYYDINIDDLSPYDIIINSESFGVEELATIVETAISLIEARSNIDQ
jgi:cytidylate kinase